MSTLESLIDAISRIVTERDMLKISNENLENFAHAFVHLVTVHPSTVEAAEEMTGALLRRAEELIKRGNIMKIGVVDGNLCAVNVDKEDAEFAKMRAELADFKKADPTLVLAQTEQEFKAFKAQAVDLAKAVVENREFIDLPIVEAARALIARAGSV